jgi:cell division protein FtsB
MMTDRSETTLPSTAEFEAHFFRDAEKVKVEVELLSETVEAVHRLAAENEWEDAEGWRAVIGAGLGYLRGERVLQALSGADRFSARDLERLLNRLAQVESMYAVLKFRTFGFLKDNQTFEFHAAALRTSVKALEMTVDRLREENERLKAEIGLLRSRPDAPAAGVAAPPAEGNPSARQGWRWRIAHWLGVV